MSRAKPQAQPQAPKVAAAPSWKDRLTTQDYD